MHILFAGGGTAGHINPALAMAGTIRQNHPDAVISYVGTPNKLEATLVPQQGYAFYPIVVSGFQRKITVKNIGRNVSAAYHAVTASIEARKLLKRLKPDVVIGTGGYVSGPVLREAAKLGIKTCIHEQNAFPGVTNKMLAGKVDRVMLAMPDAAGRMHCKNQPIITGNPVRGELLAAKREAAREKLGLDSRPLILSFGGSLGARRINESVAQLIRYHNGTGKYYQIHATGKAGYAAMTQSLAGVSLSPEIQIREYIDDMDVCMAAADLLICRAGAVTLSEIGVCGKASILIPSPYVAENHQYYNALTLSKISAARVIEEKDLTGEKLIQTVEELLNDPNTTREMGKKAKEAAISDANRRIYQVIMDLYSSR